MTVEARHKVSEGICWSLFVAPVAGLLYFVTLPLIATGTVLIIAVKKAFEGAASVVGSLFSFGWRPSEAHLSGKKKGRKKEK